MAHSPKSKASPYNAIKSPAQGTLIFLAQNSKPNSRISLWKVKQLEETRKPSNPVQDQSCGKSTSATKYVPIRPLPKPKIIYHMKLLVVQFQPSRSSLDGP
ncbi:hypothetical protein EV1_015721 [Malus domestica]